ncbi:MAG: exo-alpha-sialidase, partial [Candidatus Margulisiibacteriota bacterium]
ADGGMLRNIGCLYATEDKMYAIIQRKWNISRALMQGMSTLDNRSSSYRNDLWSSSDGIHWQVCKEGLVDAMWLFESIRLTNEGRLMGPISTHAMRPGVALWPGDDPEETPEIVEMPYRGNMDDYFTGHDEGLFVFGEASWYTDEDGRIWMWHRDESASGYLGVAHSEDGGRSWTEVMRSNFPDAMARVHAGRLSDGRFYLVGNSTRCFMNRNFFALSLSNDGARFNKMVRLIEEPTQQRFKGHLKAHGYQYPSCLVEDDKLLIVYSLNKEDIEIGIVYTSEV